jgi:hypothetical protein
MEIAPGESSHIRLCYDEDSGRPGGQAGEVSIHWNRDDSPLTVRVDAPIVELCAPPLLIAKILPSEPVQSSTLSMDLTGSHAGLSFGSSFLSCSFEQARGPRLDFERIFTSGPVSDARVTARPSGPGFHFVRVECTNGCGSEAQICVRIIVQAD